MPKRIKTLASFGMMSALVLLANWSIAAGSKTAAFNYGDITDDGAANITISGPVTASVSPGGSVKYQIHMRYENATTTTNGLVEFQQQTLPKVEETDSYIQYTGTNLVASLYQEKHDKVTGRLITSRYIKNIPNVFLTLRDMKGSSAILGSTSLRVDGYVDGKGFAWQTFVINAWYN